MSNVQTLTHNLVGSVVKERGVLILNKEGRQKSHKRQIKCIMWC